MTQKANQSTAQKPVRKVVGGTKPLPLMTLGGADVFHEYDAKRWRDGVEAQADYRYHAMVEYLRHSPSFFAALRHLEGKESPYPMPDDLEQVLPVAQDFRRIFRMRMPEWWQKHGKHLFGTPPPSAKVYVVGSVSANRPSITTLRDQHDALVIRVALNQSKREAMAALEAELDTQIAKGQFGTRTDSTLTAKYRFASKRIRRHTLAIGVGVLGYYQSKRVYPLWWIGNLFRVSPAMCLTPENSLTLSESDIAYKKQVLGVTTSRIVNNAMLIAENAARGRFPCADPFPEAMVHVFERSVGRPSKTFPQQG